MYIRLTSEVGELNKLLQKQQIIIAAYLEGKSYRSIAKEIGISRKTVAKYVREEEIKFHLKENEL
ncbi:MAG: sigma factor-like helix-turn-helix DNA-binding protein [Eubacteriales bacterium]|nr:sigma factor-like helix-turn-helix DNA-binding protein [Clostridia bacterium]MDD4494720.1 sigma factor-like helix-turn-helix DNA-binding protein [Eubacteriales bacterium]